MGAKTSEAMEQAKALVLQGVTPYAAAKQTGITRSAIYMSAWYKEHKQCSDAKPANTATK